MNIVPESARATLQTQLSSISTAESATHSEVEVLKHKIEDIEREKRDLIGVVSRLKEDGVQRDGELLIVFLCYSSLKRQFHSRGDPKSSFEFEASTTGIPGIGKPIT